MRDSSPFDCGTCSDKQRLESNCGNADGLSGDARGFEDYTDEIKEELGKGKRFKLAVGGFKFYECPLTYITEETWQLIRLVHLIDTSGHLLHSGGWANQPQWLVEAYEIYKQECNREAKRGNQNT